jgi:hypothetical protein
MPLRLDRRSATIGSSINTRTEKHGEEDVAALDIPLSKICLSDEELGVVLQNPKAHRILFATRKGQLAKFAFAKVLEVLPFRDKVRGVNVTIYLGNRKLRLPDVSLTTCRLEPQEGGTTWWSFKVQCTPTLDDTIEALLAKLNQQVDVELDCETYGAQPDLFEKDEDEEAGEQTDLEEAAGAEGTMDDETAGDPGLSRTGRNIAAHSRSKRRKH